eukprot:jgi/Bigna1/76434/fgenesh1_pg.41_\
MDVNNDGILEAKGIQVQDTIKVKNIIVEDNIKSASLTLNNQNFTTNNNNISAGIDGITTTTNDRIDFSKNIQLNAGKTITGDTANFTSINLDGGNLATQLTKISENTTNIANNTTKVNENLVQRISNDNDIANNRDRITQNTNRIINNESSINGHTVSIQSNSTRTNTNTSNITSNTNRISTNESGINTIKTDVATNTTNINTNTTTISNNTINIGSNTSNINNIGTKIDHFTINPTNINITNKDFLVNELPTGSTTGTTNIQLKTNGDVISKKLQSDNIINTNNLTTKSINVETISQKQTDGTYKSFDLNNLTTTTNNTTTANADNLISDTNNSAPLFVDTKSVHMNRNLSLNHNTMENIKGLEFTTTQSPSISYTLNDETIQINKNSLPSTIILSSASDTKIKAKEIEGVDGTPKMRFKDDSEVIDNIGEFSSSIFVNGLRSTTQPQSDGTDYTNRILSNSDGIHFTGNSIQKNNTKTEYGDIGDTINHFGSLHYFYGATTNHLQDTQVIINNGSLKIENIVLKRDDNNIFHINTNNQPAFVTTGTHSIQNGSLAVEGILKIKNDFDEPPMSSALNIQAHQNNWISFSVGTEEKANVKWDGTNLNFSVKDAKFRVNDIDVLDEISKLKNRVRALEANAGLTPGEDGVSDNMRPFF